MCYNRDMKKTYLPIRCSCGSKTGTMKKMGWLRKTFLRIVKKRTLNDHPFFKHDLVKCDNCKKKVIVTHNSYYSGDITKISLPI